MLPGPAPFWCRGVRCCVSASQCPGRCGVWGCRVVWGRRGWVTAGRQCQHRRQRCRVALCLVCSLNFACNSPEAWVRLEFTSLELQRLWASLNIQVSELHAKLFGACRPSARQRLPATLHGGNCSIRAATRRRHAGRGLLMVQNPPSGLDKLLAAGCCVHGVGRGGLPCPWRGPTWVAVRGELQH